MKLDAFDFELPPEAIAQRPTERRDGSRLMLLDRAVGTTEHRSFAELDRLLDADDLLVFNDTRVIPARVVGRKPSGGAVELLLIEAGEDGRWTALLRASKKPAPGSRLLLPGAIEATVVGRDDDRWTIDLGLGEDEAFAWLERHGSLPLPPYIRRDDDATDRERYQTLFARRPGAVAAPTAGLHFSEELLARLDRRGIATTTVTLQVGLGTFQPVRVEDIEDHTMHLERYDVPTAAWARIEETRARGGRVVAVGTTVVRALESARGPGSGRSDLFITPGYNFAVVDALITNFHLPRSTLLMLVSAFAGRERVLAAYREAVEAGYRFFSYGDAMWIR